MMKDGCSLYRHFDADGGLLYVGISLRALRRLAEHAKSQWADQIVSVTVESFPNRAEAAKAERAAILNEAPRFNVAMKAKAHVPLKDIAPLDRPMTAAERQQIKRDRQRAGLVRIEVWVPSELEAAVRAAAVEAAK
jgi:excinuclease UvrABC nuclease subunit